MTSSHIEAVSGQPRRPTGRRLIVQVEWGPLRGKKTLIEPGQTIRIGRYERADLIVPRDEELSGLHLELSWDGARCFGRDLGSSGGTDFNGEPGLLTAELGHKDWFRAGTTFFSVTVEGQVSPFRDAKPLSDQLRAKREEAVAALQAEQAPLFAVVDAARHQRPLTLFAAAVDEVASLYDGAAGEELAEVAPYLAQLPRDSWLFDRLMEEGWGRGWFVLLSCQRPFAEVRRQLRRLLIVEEQETQEPMYFRFYDPAVLPAVIKVATPRQLQQIFGEISAFFVETADGDLRRLANPQAPH